MKLLIELGVDIYAKWEDGMTPLFETLRCGCTKSIKILRQAGAR
jgi:hypothetical protein